MIDMSEMSVKDRLERNHRVVEEFRAHGGKVEGSVPLILLTTAGAKSGQPRTYPLIAVPDGDNYFAVSSKLLRRTNRMRRSLRRLRAD